MHFLSFGLIALTRLKLRWHCAMSSGFIRPIIVYFSIWLIINRFEVVVTGHRKELVARRFILFSFHESNLCRTGPVVTVTLNLLRTIKPQEIKAEHINQGIILRA